MEENKNYLTGLNIEATVGKSNVFFDFLYKNVDQARALNNKYCKYVEKLPKGNVNWLGADDYQCYIGGFCVAHNQVDTLLESFIEQDKMNVFFDNFKISGKYDIPARARVAAKIAQAQVEWNQFKDSTLDLGVER